MLTSALAHTARSWPPPKPLKPPQPRAALPDSLGAVENETHIIVLDRDGPELMCALLRAGAPQVTHLRSPERLESASASLIIVPRVSSPEWLERALPSMRRALISHGHLVICCDPVPGIEQNLRRVLTLHDFITVRTSRTATRHVVCTEIAAFGQRHIA